MFEIFRLYLPDITDYVISNIVCIRDVQLCSRLFQRAERSNRATIPRANRKYVVELTKTRAVGEIFEAFHALRITEYIISKIFRGSPPFTRIYVLRANVIHAGGRYG